MYLFPTSITLTNLLGFVCRFLSCDNEYQTPVINRASASDRIVEAYNGNGNDIFGPVHEKGLPEVSTTSGNVRGYYMTVIRGKQICAFEGIPYAEPPTGRRRFRDPVPKAPWEGFHNATSSGSLCLQLHFGRLRGSEDCLCLSVYTKNINPIKPYPVVVFTHGGFWLSGSGGHYGPSYLLERDVVLITYNYRLGSLGFFSTGDEVSKGNWGMKDQSLVIDWVHSNIKNFGGDPERIILSGSSAGSASTHLHMFSNYPSKNKLKGAISLSGTGYNVWALNRLETAKTVSMALADISGCPSTLDSEVIMTCMREMDANVIVANQLLIFGSGFFLPHIEPNVTGAFLTATPDEAYSQGLVAKIPWIVSMTSRELNLPVTALQENLLVSFLRSAFSSDLASLLSFRRKGVDEEEVRKKIIKFYIGDGGSINDLSREEFSKIATHRYFTVPIRKAIQMHSQVAPTYATIFNYSSILGRAGRLGFSPATGTLHGDDLVYFLNSTRNHPPIGRFDSHFAITKLLVNLYGNFAKYGEPLFTTEDNEEYKIWDVVDNKDRLRYLWIDEEVKMINDPYESIAKFWEELGLPDTTSSFTL